MSIFNHASLERTTTFGTSIYLKNLIHHKTVYRRELFDTTYLFCFLTVSGEEFNSWEATHTVPERKDKVNIKAIFAVMISVLVPNKPMKG